MNTSHVLPRSTPEAQSVSSSALLAFIAATEHNNLELHSLMLLRHGVVVAEGWWSPYRAEYPHLLNSVSKSFTSTAVGLAVAERRLSINDLVISFFPDALPDVVSDALAALKVKHLLTMSTGHSEDTITTITSRVDGDWIRAFLNAPIIYAPGTHFVYNSGATYMLSAIIQKVTGTRLLDYLQPRLLEPLGITNATWDISPQGIAMGGWGMSVPTEAIARFGQLYLQNGMWNGQQLVPAEWIAEATAYQISNAHNENIDWQQGYGYQFWRSQYGAYRGDGAFGQYCVVMPEQDAVLAITGSVYNMQAVMDLVWEHIRPGIHTEQALPVQAEAADRLLQKLASLHIDPPIAKTTSFDAAIVSVQCYTLDTNPLTIESIQFDFSTSGCEVTIQTVTSKHNFTCGVGRWQPGTLTLFRHSPHMVASGIWTTEDIFEITLRFYETSAIYTIQCHFTPGKVTIAMHIDYILGVQDYHLVGSIQSGIVNR